MKKFLLFMVVLALLLSSIPVLSASDYITIVLDGVELEPKDVNGNIVRPMLHSGTTYLPVRAIATALNLDIVWDNNTKSVFINGVCDAEKGEYVNIFINGTKLVPTDVNGKEVHPILLDGTTYLPIRAVSEQFNKTVSWEQETHTVLLTTPSTADFEEGKVYAFINKASGKAITLTDNGLSAEKFESYTHQGFKLIKSDTDGYYYIQSALNNKNFDVNGNSKNPGASIITYNAGTADNQKFKLENTTDGYLVYALSSHLPVEDSADMIKQNAKRDSLVQKWEIREFTPVEKPADTLYTLTAGGFILADEESSEWLLTPNENGEYIITNAKTSKSLDVANNSTTSGDPVITYDTSSDPNQRWIFERQADGTYLIKSVHSSLYLSVVTSAEPGELIQSELNEAYQQHYTQQCWTLSAVK